MTAPACACAYCQNRFEDYETIYDMPAIGIVCSQCRHERLGTMRHTQHWLWQTVDDTYFEHEPEADE